MPTKNVTKSSTTNIATEPFYPNMPTGNLIFVDPINGNDSTGSAGSNTPFLTLSAALSAYAAGHTIYVFPGEYSITAPLTGGNWYFCPGSTVTYDVYDDLNHIFEISSGDCLVFGHGKFVKILSVSESISDPENGAIKISGGNVTFKCQSVQTKITPGAGDVNSGSVLFQSGGSLYFECDQALGDPSLISQIQYGIWWTGGNGGAVVKSTLYVGCSIGSAVDGSGSSANFYYNADEVGQRINGAYGIAVFGTDSSAALWVRSGTVMGDYVDAAIQIVGVNKLYVTAQKIFGLIYSGPSAGLWYISSDKISLTDSGSAGFSGEGWVACEGGTGFLSIKHWYSPEINPTTKFITMDGGSLVVDGGFMQATSNVAGITNTSGTLRLNGVRIDTTANSGTSPITKAGGTVILDDVVLVSQGANNSIGAGAAQNVLVYGGAANNAVHANVTQQVGTLVVNALVQ